MKPSIEQIIKEMTLEEKAALTIGGGFWSTTPIDRLGVPEVICTDGPHGVRRMPDPHSSEGRSLPATAFPTASCAASTWNLELIEKEGEALAEECNAFGIDLLLGPGVCMKRSPLCGRNFEYFSEDPFLAGKLAAAWIKGMQRKGTGASIKHYAANNQEFHRMFVDAQIDERTLREIYLTAFEIAVKEAQPWTVMCSYNRINGYYGSESHKLLTEILKNEWGFEGFVVSDWGAVHDRVKALKAGLDLEMPGDQLARLREIIAAVKDGSLDEAVLDEAVRRILRIAFKSKEKRKNKTYNHVEHHALAREVAAEGIVLLKNTGLLPLKGVKSVAVIGRTALKPFFEGGGSSNVRASEIDILMDAFEEVAPRVAFSQVEGYPEDREEKPVLIKEAVKAAKAADAALLMLALPEFDESEGYDRPNLDLTAHQVALIKAVTKAQPKTVVVINSGAPIAMSEWIDLVPAVLQGWMFGQGGASPLADILFGRLSPSGKLAETFPIKIEDTPAYLNWPGENGVVRYGEGLFIGYRYYDAKKIPVQFPFGHGLSYTSFAYGEPKLSKESIKADETLTVSIDVTNTGKMAGKEAVQLYVRPLQSKLVRPVKELKGFAKLSLDPGETKTAEIKLSRRAFAYYHPVYKDWVVDDGKFELLIGASSADIRASAEVTVTENKKLPSLLHGESTLREWDTDPKGKPIFEAFMAKAQTAQPPKETKPGEEPELIAFFMELMMPDMPLRDVLQFMNPDPKRTAQQVLDDMLAKARK
jgi:beta-glucosidase